PRTAGGRPAVGLTWGHRPTRTDVERGRAHPGLRSEQLGIRSCAAHSGGVSSSYALRGPVAVHRTGQRLRRVRQADERQVGRTQAGAAKGAETGTGGWAAPVRVSHRRTLRFRNTPALEGRTVPEHRPDERV